MSASQLGLGFVAGVLAVPVFHQILLWILHAAGIVPIAPFNMAPTKPLGIPEVVSISFWGGVWGIVFALTLPRWFSGTAYWIAAPVAAPLRGVLSHRRCRSFQRQAVMRRMFSRAVNE